MPLQQCWIALSPYSTVHLRHHKRSWRMRIRLWPWLACTRQRTMVCAHPQYRWNVEYYVAHTMSSCLHAFPMTPHRQSVPYEGQAMCIQTPFVKQENPANIIAVW